MNKYIGHPTQLYGIEEHRLVGGKGDGMRLLQANNGRGLMFTVSADRCGDISRLYFNGKNLGYFSPAGYVAPSYYDDKGAGFLKSFTAGFLTTCGFTAVGSPCTDDGEELPLHGTIANTPAENVRYWVDDSLHIVLTVRDAAPFSHKLVLTREITCPLDKDEIIIKDTVKNEGFSDSPYMILYHFNMGYPLLSENSIVTLSQKDITPRNEHAKSGIDKALIMEKPQPDFEEQCYYFDMTKGEAKIYSPDIDTTVSINYDVKEMPFFTEWKMMGTGEYVLGLEPGNCTPDGRDVMRKNGTLSFIKSGEEKSQTITIKVEKGQ